MAKTPNKRISAAEYRRNLKRSLKYAAGGAAKIASPTLSYTIATNKAVISQLKRQNSSGKSQFKQQVSNMKKSIFSPTAKFMSNLKSDFKSGKFYNEERQGEAQDTAINNLMGWESDNELALEKAKSTSSIGAMRGNIDATLSSAEYIGDVVNETSANQLLTSSKFSMMQISSLQNIERIGMALVDFNVNVMADHIERTHKFYDDILEQVSDTNSKIGELSTIFNTRFGVGKGPSTKDHPLMSVLSSFGGFNLGEYGKLVKGNIARKSGVNKDLMKMIVESFSASPISSILSLFGDSLIPKNLKKGFGDLNNSMSGLFASYIMQMNEMSRTGKSGLSRFLGSILGTRLNQDLKPDLSIYKDRELTLQVEQKKAKAITEVIPTQLGAIVKALTGRDKIYDYDTGKFVDREKRKDDLDKYRKESIMYGMHDTRASMSMRFSAIRDKFDAGSQETINKDMESFIYFLATLGENFDPKTAISKYEYYKKLGLNLIGGKQSYRTLVGLYASMTKSQQSAARNEQMQSILRNRSIMDAFNENLYSSGNSAVYNMMYDGDVANAVKKKLRKQASDMKAAGINTKFKVNGMSIDDTIDAVSKSGFMDDDAAREKFKKEHEAYMRKLRGELGEDGADVIDGGTKKLKEKLTAVFSKIGDKLTGSNSVVSKVLNSTSEFIYSILYGGKSTDGKGIIGHLIKTVSSGVANGVKYIKTGLFGGTDKDGNEKKGLFSKDASAIIMKYMPRAAKGAALGALTGIVTKHPFLGAMVGAGINVLVGTSKVQKILWGDKENDPDDDGLLGGLKKQITKFMKDHVFSPIKKRLMSGLNKGADWIMTKTGLAPKVKRHARDKALDADPYERAEVYRKYKGGVRGLFRYGVDKVSEKITSWDKRFNDKKNAGYEDEGFTDDEDGTIPISGMLDGTVPPPGKSRPKFKAVRLSGGANIDYRDYYEYLCDRLDRPIPVYITGGDGDGTVAGGPSGGLTRHVRKFGRRTGEKIKNKLSDEIRSRTGGVNPGATDKEAKKTQDITRRMIKYSEAGQFDKAKNLATTALQTSNSSADIQRVVDATDVLANTQQAQVAGFLNTQSITSSTQPSLLSKLFSGLGNILNIASLFGGGKVLLGGAAAAGKALTTGGSFLDGVFGAAPAKASFGSKLWGGVKAAGRTVSNAYTTGLMLKGGADVIGGATQVIGGDGSVDASTGSANMLRGTGRLVSGAAFKASRIAKGKSSTVFIGPVIRLVTKFIQGIGAKVATKFPGLAKFGSSIATKISGSAVGMMGANAAKFVAKYSNFIGWAIVIAQAVWDFTTGLNESQGIMQTTNSYDTPTGLKIACGLAKAISGFLLGLIPVKWLAGVIFDVIGSKEDKEALKTSQESALAAYNKVLSEGVNKDLTFDKYNRLMNKTTWDKFTDNVKRAFGGKASSLYDYGWTPSTEADYYTGSGGRGDDSGYYSQKDSRWSNIQYGTHKGTRDTIGKGGCAPATAAMMMQRLTGDNITPDSVADLALRYGMKNSGGGTSAELFNVLGSKYGKSFKTTSGLSDSAIESLKNGQPVAFLGRGGAFGKGSHYVLGTGIDSNGNISILDPQNKSNNKAFSKTLLTNNTLQSIIPSVAGRGAVPETNSVAGVLSHKRSLSLEAEIKHAMDVTGRGNSATTDVSTSMLAVLTTIAETLLRIDSTNAAIASKPPAIITGGTTSSNIVGGTNNNSSQISPSKLPLYNSILSGD